MKKISKILSLLLALTMVLSLNLGVLTVHATGYTIKITNPSTITEAGNHSYKAYQIFSGRLEQVDADYVLSDIEWGTGFDSTKASDFYSALSTAAETNSGDTNQSLLKDYIDANGDIDSAEEYSKYLQTLTTDSKAIAAEAERLAAYLTDVCSTSSYDSSEYTISVDNAGYYLIVDDAGQTLGTDDAFSDYILKVVKDVEITAKVDIPTVEKKVKEESYTTDDGYGTGYNDVADYDIGDTVPFKLIGTLPSKLSDYSSYKVYLPRCNVSRSYS